MKTSILASLLLFSSVASAADVKVAWQAPVNATDEKGVVSPLPPGVLTYDVWGYRDGETPKLRTSTTSTSTIRTNVAAGKQCYYVIANFKPLETTLDTWLPSPPSGTSCLTVTAPTAGPRNMTPMAPQVVTVTTAP